MKKRYEKPETACMQIETLSFVAASDVMTFNIDNPTDPTDQEDDIDKSHKSRTFNVWDD